MTTASSWIFPYNPHRSRVASLHHQHPPRITDGIQASPMGSLGGTALLAPTAAWYKPQRLSRSHSNISELDSGQNISMFEERNEVKCAGQLCWLRCHCCSLFIVVCQDWWVSRTKQALVLKGCLMKETSFNFILCLHATRGSVYLES